MTVSAQSIIKTVVLDILVDPTSVRWPMDELTRFFNDGQRDICVHRPDAQVSTVSIALAAGTKQALPAAATKLLQVHRNTGGNKRAVTKADKDLLDEQLPNWHGMTGVTEILHFCYDGERDDRTFYVYPPAANSGASLEATVAVLPTDITLATAGQLYTDISGVGNMSLPDIFANAMQNYIAYRCYAKDSDAASNAARATAHYQLYANDLGIELKATQGVAPVTAPSLRPRAG